tara:strand:+ start:267 stop:689 length:423 start_codon:yes stop_codon:yes gene_type:complete
MMGEEFYAIIKLVSGEEIMSVVMADDNNDEVILILQNPVIMQMCQNGVGHYIKVKPWMDLNDEDMHIIKLDKVITMSETTNKKLISIYDNFIETSDEQIKIPPIDGKVKPNSKMGYVSSVEDARKILEEIFKIKPESKES